MPMSVAVMSLQLQETGLLRPTPAIAVTATAVFPLDPISGILLHLLPVYGLELYKILILDIYIIEYNRGPNRDSNNGCFAN